jgi:fumarate reductase subunit C
MGKALNPDYTPFHPKWYRRRIPIFWWLRKRAYVKFIARELTSPFAAYAALLLLIQVWALASGAVTYSRFMSLLARGPVILWHAFVLLCLLFHSITWLNLAPKALVLRLGKKRLPDWTVRVAHYAAWFAVSAFTAWILIGTG